VTELIINCTGPRLSSIPVAEPLSTSGKRPHSPDIGDEDDFHSRRCHLGKIFYSPLHHPFYIFIFVNLFLCILFPATSFEHQVSDTQDVDSDIDIELETIFHDDPLDQCAKYRKGLLSVKGWNDKPISR
jgi:hypothetical protein